LTQLDYHPKWSSLPAALDIPHLITSNHATSGNPDTDTPDGISYTGPIGAKQKGERVTMHIWPWSNKIVSTK
jgi:hypothetical protein